MERYIWRKRVCFPSRMHWSKSGVVLLQSIGQYSQNWCKTRKKKGQKCINKAFLTLKVQITRLPCLFARLCHWSTYTTLSSIRLKHIWIRSRLALETMEVHQFTQAVNLPQSLENKWESSNEVIVRIAFKCITPETEAISKCCNRKLERLAKD